MKDHHPHPEYPPPLTPLISAIAREFQERHDLAELIALHAACPRFAAATRSSTSSATTTAATYDVRRL